MAVNLQENSLYFRMFQVLVTPCLKIKVNLSPKTTSQTQHHLLDGEILPNKALSRPSLLAFRLQSKLDLGEIWKADSAFHNSTAWGSKQFYYFSFAAWTDWLFAILLSFYLTPFR